MADGVVDPGQGQHIRTHVDVTDPKLTAMEAMLELKEELRDVMDIQIVVFPQEGILSYPKGKELLEQSVKMGADCVGPFPISKLPGSTAWNP